jgi:hypothetical protein
MLTEIQKEVLKFLIKTFSENDIEYEATGGLAAIAYGAKRHLSDIDLEIYKKDTHKVGSLLKEFITEDWNNDLEGEDDVFDLWILKLEINGVPIDISQMEDSRVRAPSGEWIPQPEIMESQIRSVEGIDLAVQSKESLIAYKKLLPRDNQREDLRQIG